MQDASPNLGLDRLGDEIAELSAHLDAATARLLDLIREFDARGGWSNGFRSCAAWLNWRVGLDMGAARERVRVARALGSLPSLAQALARGELSYAKVRALTRVATPETEERLLVVGRAGTADHVERIVPGGGPRRCPGPGGSRRARSVHARERHPRFRGNVPMPGVRCQPCRDAACPGRSCRRGRRPDTHDPAGDPTSAAPSRPGLSLPGLRRAVRTRSSHRSLG